jgi:hypothetical protein
MNMTGIWQLINVTAVAFIFYLIYLIYKKLRK